MEPRGTFGRRLRALLRERGMTQGELSRRMYGDIGNRTLVQKWVNGRFEPGYASLHMMREALGCTWEELMGE